jgi:hypothetical protein
VIQFSNKTDPAIAPEAAEAKAPHTEGKEGPGRKWRVAILAGKQARFGAAAVAAIAVLLLARPISRQPAPEIWSNWQAAVRGRAATVLEDDFRGGLRAWDGEPGWAMTWTYDPSGFVRVGRLGLLRASLGLSNYKFEFYGQIEKKGLGWVFRAKDRRNHYTLRIVITKPGPLPVAAIVRYAVVDGKSMNRVQFPLPVTIQSDSLYRVETIVNGNQFTTSVNGRVVDTFSDARFSSGGVGLVAEAGEAARVKWVRVSDQEDLLGQLCAYLSGQTTDRRGEESVTQ